MTNNKKFKKKKTGNILGRKANYLRALKTFGIGAGKTTVKPGDRGVGVTFRGGEPIAISNQDARAAAKYKTGAAEKAESAAKLERSRRKAGVAAATKTPARLATSKSRTARAVGRIPQYLQAAAGAIEAMTAGAAPKAAEADRQREMRAGKGRYDRAIERIKSSGALKARPGTQDTGMDGGSGATVHIPDTWDLDLYRKTAHDLRMSGSGGATGGRMSVQEAHAAAAAMFRDVYGDERDWDSKGTMTDEYGAEITTEAFVTANRAARAGETARLTGRAVSFRGGGKDGIRAMLPDRTAAAQRKLEQAAAAAAVKKTPAAARTLKERVAGFDSRSLYNTEDMTADERKAAERIHTRIDRLRNAVAAGRITPQEGERYMRPLISRLADGTAAKHAAAAAKARADAEEKTRAAAIYYSKLKVEHAKQNYDLAVSDAAETEKRIEAIKEAIYDSEMNRDPDGDPAVQDRLAAKLQNQRGQLAELESSLATARAAARTMRDAWDAAREEHLQINAPTGGETAGPQAPAAGPTRPSGPVDEKTLADFIRLLMHMQAVGYAGELNDEWAAVERRLTPEQIQRVKHALSEASDGSP